jgi:hypothetical protein
MATVSKSSIVISAAISASGSGGTIYTAPASSYALVNLYVSGSGVTVSVGGQQAFVSSGSSSFQLVVGPSQSIQISGAALPCYVSGVLFANS